MAEQKVTWYGASGKAYTYWVHPIEGTIWDDAPGNYIFSCIFNNRWQNLYTGQTNSLRDRLNSNHHAWDCGKRHGMTHIHAHTTGNGSSRIAEESDLITKHNPPCNG